MRHWNTEDAGLVVTSLRVKRSFEVVLSSPLVRVMLRPESPRRFLHRTALQLNRRGGDA